jgi:hypothetical protein
MEVKTNKFNPIIITIHTEREARILWHLLNCPIAGTTIKEWFEIENEEGLIDVRKYNRNDTLTDMWHNFNEVYPLRKRQ